MTRANTIASLRAARRTLYGISIASFLLILWSTPESKNESAESSENRSQNKGKSVAFLVPNKEPKIQKEYSKK